MFTANSSRKPEINGGPLKNSYTFSQFHFHWCKFKGSSLYVSFDLLSFFLADNDTYGSEDSINGKYFPMELHIVFYKSLYKSQENAKKHSDGLAVLAFFFIISQKPNSAYVEV